MELVLRFTCSAQSLISFRYFFYDSGELFRVLDSTGTLVQYTVDPAGNITQTTRSTLLASALSILNVTPLSTTLGSTLTIYGQNFSGNPANDIVQINGVNAAVLSATSNQIVIQVPLGATMGQITVTVNGVTVSSGSALVFTPIPPSVISGVSPSGAAGGQNVTITVTGTNLYSASFYFANGLGVVTSATIKGDGTGATLQAALAAASGIDNIVAVNTLGTSLTGAGNQFTVLSPGVPTSGTAISSITISTFNAVSQAGTRMTTGPPISTLNEISQPGTNLAATPTISALNSVSQSGTQLSSSPAVSALNAITQPGFRFATELLTVLNYATAPGGAAAMSPWISVVNSNSSGNAITTASKPSSTNTGNARPTIRLSGDSSSPATSLKVTPGQTVSFDITAGQGGSSALLLDGAQTDDPATAGTRRFVIPFGTAGISAVVRDGGVDSDLINLTVQSDMPKRISGRLLLPGGMPAVERRMEIRSTGLTAEYFQWKTPLTALPDLTGLNPDRVGVVSSLAMENPSAVFGADPFGTGLTPNYAARFTGAIKVDAEGMHQFFLTSHAGSRLLIDGQVVTEVLIASGPSTATGSVQLTPGWHAIEVDHFEASGAPELRLEWERPGISRETVDPAHLTPAHFWSAQTDTRGAFTISDFPAFLEPLEFRAVCEGRCSIVMEQNQ
jgi:hypothetical protein